MRMQMAALAMASVLLTTSGALAAPAGDMTIKDFRLRAETNQISMVFGAIALTDRLHIICPVTITVGEWRAALAYRNVDVAKPWIDVLLELMDERGCKGETAKADT